MNELMTVDYSTDEPTILGRDLHEALGVQTAYKDWFPRMCEYGFSEGTDYCSFLSDRCDGLAGKPRNEHRLTINMAKELCMIQRTEKGKQCRQYFIEVERRWNDPASIMSRALMIAKKQIDSLQSENAQLAQKAQYFDALVDHGNLTSLRDAAKILGIPEHAFIAGLIDKKFLFRNQSRKLMPYAEKNRGFFEVKEYVNDKTGATGIQTMVTVKGREHFMKLFAA